MCSWDPLTIRVNNVRLAWCLNSVLNVKALLGAFNQEKALVVIVKTDCETNGSFHSTILNIRPVIARPRGDIGDPVKHSNIADSLAHWPAPRTLTSTI